MSKTFLAVVLIILWCAASCYGESGTADRKLIPVKPSYHEAAYVPEQQVPAADSAATRAPTPREQMYVFWILGRMLSYPMDKAESYIRQRLQRSALKPASAPATSTPASSPFDSMNLGQIPPAPPALGGVASDK